MKPNTAMLGEVVEGRNGMPVPLRRPLDFLVIAAGRRSKFRLPGRRLERPGRPAAADPLATNLGRT